MSPFFGRLLPAFVLTALLAALVVVQPVYASGIVVNDAGDTTGPCSASGTGTCTLRDAITFANSNSGSDTITFAANYTITLAGSELPVVTTTIIINGNGVANSVIQAALTSGVATSRVLEVNAGGNLTLHALTVRNGNAPFAGGILSNGSLTLDNAEVSDNTSAGRGGGIYNHGGTLIIQNGSEIGKSGSPNTACTGGGVFAEGLPTTATTMVDASTVSYNVSQNCAGGGFYLLYDSHLTVQNGSAVTHNSAGDPSDPLALDRGGGAIYASASPVITIKDSTFSNNTVACVAADCGGGAIRGGSSITITKSTFSGNSGEIGGAIYNLATLSVTDSTFSDNSANSFGGGIDNFANSGTATVTNSTFSGNSVSGSVNASGLGGGIYQGGSPLTVTNSTFSGNSANCQGTGHTFCGLGGGIMNDKDTLTVTSSTFSDNSASCDQGNTSCGLGGGIYSHPGELHLTNTILANSTSVDNDDCYNQGSNTLDTNINNLIETTTSPNACGTPSLQSDPVLAGLQDNGGPTFTMALMPLSPAIDSANAAACPSTDQRGAPRPQGGGCDIGAFELDTIPPKVIADSLASSYGTGPGSFTIKFSEGVSDVGNGSGTDDVTNPDNYRVVEAGTDGIFQTASCAGGLAGDDVQAPVSGVTYDAGSHVATVDLGTALPDGTYRLFVCGTTSIVDNAQLALAGDGTTSGTDYTFDFVVGATASKGGGEGPNVSGQGQTLPLTGFPPNRFTSLPPQPAGQLYDSTELTLEIPSLKVNLPIVGVPQTKDGWDVTWLAQNAGWLNGTAFPTWAGNSVLTGHVWNADNTPGVFAHLKELKYGDQIKVHAFGRVYAYAVRESRTVWPSQAEIVLQHEDRSYLTLLTCEDYRVLWGSYSVRRMVRAVLVDVGAQ